MEDVFPLGYKIYIVYRRRGTKRYKISDDAWNQIYTIKWLEQSTENVNAVYEAWLMTFGIPL